MYAICGDDVEELAKKIKTLKSKKASLQKMQLKPKKAIKKHMIHALKIAKETFENGTIEEKRQIVDALISKVVLYNDSIKIEWNF